MTRRLLTVCNKLKTFSSEQLLYFDQPFDLQSNTGAEFEGQIIGNYITKPTIRYQIADLTSQWGYVDICRGGGGAGSALGRCLNGFEENEG